MRPTRALLPAAVLLLGLTASAAAQERIIPEGWRRIYDTYHYAPAVRVGNVLYLSGVVAGDSVPEQQFDRAFQTLRNVLEASGSSLDRIVEMTTYHVRMGEHIETFMKVKDRYLTGEYPAWTAIGIERLFSPRALVEIKVVALVRS